MPAKVNSELARLRAKEQLYDELVEQLAVTERKLTQVTELTTNRSVGTGGDDPAWREIANDLATALRPYTLLSQRRSQNDPDLAAGVVEDAVLGGVEGGGVMAEPQSIDQAASVREWRAKAAIYDDLVEHLAAVEAELGRLRAQPAGIDPGWREIANDLAAALRPYSLFREMVVRDGRIVVETSVPGLTLTAARQALDRLGEQVARESYRESGMAPGWSEAVAPDGEEAEKRAA